MLFSRRSYEQKGTEDKLPSLNHLAYCAKHNLRQAYKNNTASRLELIALLEILHEILSTQSSAYIETDLREIALGGWVFCLEVIANEYKLHQPQRKEGYLYHSGSLLYKILLEQSKLQHFQDINSQTKLKWLMKFYHFFLHEKSMFDQHIHSKKIKLPLEKSLIEIMGNELKKESCLEKHILKAVPCETAIDHKMIRLYTDYMRLAKKKNPDRIMLAKLAVAVCKDNMKNDNEVSNTIPLFFSRSERIKLGMLIYIMHSITNTYKVRSPKAHSVLYHLCHNILLDSFSGLNNATKAICLQAFLDYIQDGKNKERLEKFINKNLNNDKTSDDYTYLDLTILSMTQSINEMIRGLLPSNSLLPKASKLTWAMAGLGVLIGSPTGYGMGHTIGYGISLMDQMNKSKEMLSGLTRKGMNIFFETGTYFGYYTADIMATVVLERFFGSLFEKMGAIVFAGSIGGVTYILYDVSFKTMCHLLYEHFKSRKDAGVSTLNQSDMEFIHLLLEMPEAIFSNTKKEKLKIMLDLSGKVSSFSFLTKPSLRDPSFETNMVQNHLKTPSDFHP